MNKDKDKEKEEWRDCPSAPGYQVSSLGNVRGKYRIVINNGHSYYKKAAPCKKHIDKNGYVFVRINPQNKGSLKDIKGNARTKKFYVHILVCEAFNGLKPFEGAEVDHEDRVRTNNIPSNLAWKTRLENAQNRVLNPAKGENSNLSKLTEEEAKYIIENKDKVSVKDMVKKLDGKVSSTTIRNIQNRKAWKHLWEKLEKASQLS